MKIRILSTIIAICAAILPAYSSVLEVCATCEYSSIKSAIDAAQKGDLIIIREGVYREGRIVVSKSLHIRGIGYPTLDGGGESEILTITADNVIVEGLRINHVGHSYTEDRAGIRVQRASGVELCDNRLDDNFFGIYLEHASDIRVHRNTILGKAVTESSSGNAIHSWYCKRITITDNIARGHRDGIYLEFTESSKVSGNISKDNLRYGLHFMFSNDNSYDRNIFMKNGAGVAVMFSRRIQMHANRFEQNWGKASYGLLLKEINDADISGNIFKENTIGILVEGSNRIEYHDNLIARNGWAIKIAGGCLDNKIYNNNFMSNTFDLSVHSAAREELLSHNYWSQYSGYDLDRDGIGDVPYRPVKLYNYVVDKTPEAMILLRSLFIDLLNFSEKVSPVFTPKKVLDNKPRMDPVDFSDRGLLSLK